MAILETKELVYRYSPGTPFEKTAVDQVSIQVEKGEFLGVIGHTGSGKSTLIQMLNGLLRPTSGQVLLDGKDIWAEPKKIRQVRFKVGMVFQYPEYQLFEETVLKDIMFGPKNKGLSDQEAEERAREAAHFTGLKAELLEKSPFELSGGEKRRAAIAGVIAMDPDVLILDEPTNDLDIKTLMILEDYLDSFQGIVITVSHDRYFLDRVVRRIFAFEGDGVLRQYEGGFTDYAARKAAEAEAEEESRADVKPAAPPKEKGQRIRGPQKLKFTYKEQKDYETIEADMAALEERITGIEEEIQASARDFVKLNQLMEEKEKAEKELEEKMDRWMYLEELAAKIAEQQG